jgi:hypothetical protein
MAIVAVFIVVGVAMVMLAGGSTFVGSGKLSASDIAGYAANAGFSGPDLQVAVAVALAESGGDPNAVGDQTLAPSNGPSIGLWQINTGSKAHPDAAALNLTDPQTNANYAYQIYSKAGQSFGAWTTYGNGDYAAFIVTAQNAVTGVAA